MGIYIKGMKMPTNCDDCLLGSDCPHDQSIDGYKMQGGRPRTCPFVPVPPHGRLIEESKVLNIVSAWCPDDDGSVGKVGDLREMLDEIEALPTIIPAEQKGE